MKRFFGFMVLAMLLLFVDAFPAGPFIPDSMATISKAKSMNAYIFSSAVKPFGWSDTINVASADWSCPDSIWVKGIYVNKFCTVSLQTRGSGKAVPIVLDSLSGLMLDIKYIYTTGTTEAARAGGVIVLIGDRAW
jgi:hypothetical protein